MAICRFSSDDYQCDFYIYEDVEGYITMWIAGNHAIFDRSELPERPSWNEAWEDTDIESKEWEEYTEKYVAHSKTMSSTLWECERERIDHPHANGHFTFNTPDEVVKFLEEEIIPTGKFIVPDWLIDDLKNWELIGDDD